MSRTRRKAIKAGYRSGFEQSVIEALTVPYEYETEKLHYIVPESKHVYTPDLLFKKKAGGTMYVELKGKLDVATRMKMIHVKASNPDLDIRLMFMNPRQRITKRSKTMYWEWAEQHGYPWCGPILPKEWLNEISSKK